MTQNPFLEIRSRHQLSRLKLAALARCSYHAVYSAERGLPLRPHRGLLEACEALGYSPPEVLARYHAFRQSLARAP